MKKALITGITGQDGSYLAEFLLEKGYEVHGIVRRTSTYNTKRIDHLYENPAIFNKTLFTHYGDVTDPINIISIIAKHKPDEIYNLAAQSHVKVSFDEPHYTAQVDALGTLAILEAARTNVPNARIYQASTSELFGGIPKEMPKDGFDENTPFHPRSPYGVAKIYGYWATKNYREAYNTFACNGILFNHESPRRGETFVTRKITLWLAKYIKLNGAVEPLQIGNIDAYRDWGHAKDYVETMYAILQQPKPDDYVISTGEAHSVREFIQTAFNVVGKHVEWHGDTDNEYATINGSVVIQVNKEYYRPSEVPYLLGNNSKARRVLGWKPKHTFYDLVSDMVNSDLKG